VDVDPLEADEGPDARPERVESSHSPSAIQPDADALRASLLERFDAWLRDVLADEAPPEGLPAEMLREFDALPAAAPQDDAPERGDRLALWSALTALTQEVKLQGRAFNRLQDTLKPLAEMRPALSDNLAAHEEALRLAGEIARQALAARAERGAELERQAEQRATRALLDVLLDARDRLARGLGLAHSHAAELARLRGWRAALGLGRAATRRFLDVTLALEEGYRLALRRIDEALEQLGVHPIECAGKLFDPHFMTATDVADEPDVPDGVVLEVHRTGYAWKGEALRHAEVKVARADRSVKQGTDDEPA